MTGLTFVLGFVLALWLLAGVLHAAALAIHRWARANRPVHDCAPGDSCWGSAPRPRG